MMYRLNEFACSRWNVEQQDCYTGSWKPISDWFADLTREQAEARLRQRIGDHEFERQMSNGSSPSIRCQSVVE